MPQNKIVCLRPHETLIACNYETAFEDMMNNLKELRKKLKERERSRCRTASTIRTACEDDVPKSCASDLPVKSMEHRHDMSKDKNPCSDQNTVEVIRLTSTCVGDIAKPKNSKEHRHGVTKDQYPCCDQDSDDCDDVKTVPIQKEKFKQRRTRPGSTRVKPRKPKARPNTRDNQGCFASCCPYFSKSKATPVCGKSEESRPVSEICDNAKVTQTTKEDFILAKKQLKEAIKEEKKQQKLNRIEMRCEQKLECKDVEEPRRRKRTAKCDNKEKSEAEYRRARDNYRQKRKKMEDKINESLQKEMRKKKC